MSLTLAHLDSPTTRKVLLCSTLAVAASALAWNYLRQRKYPKRIPSWMFREKLNRKDRHPSFGAMEIFEALGRPKTLLAYLVFGLIKTVWLPDYETMKEFMIQHQKLTSDRWDNAVVQDSGSQLGIADATADDVQPRRKLVLQTMRKIGLGKSQLENQVSLEAEKLVEFMAKLGDLDCREFSREFMRATANIICSLVLGKRFDYDDGRMDELFYNLNAVLEQPLFLMLGSGLPRPFCWIFRFFNDSGLERIRCYNAIKSFGDKEIVEHKEHPEIQGTIVRACLDMQMREPEKFPDDVIQAMLADLLIAGSDTSSHTLEFCVLHLILDQDLQEQLYKELCAELEPDLSDLSMENTDKIPLTIAFIHETLRFTPAAPGTLPHVSKVDVQMKCGTVIPAGSLVIGSQMIIMRTDPRWKNPSEFDVRNFLTEDGRFTKPEMFVPFGLGPRSCVGEKLAKLEILMFLAHMIKKFKFLPVEGQEYDGRVGAYSAVMKPKPYKVKTVIRN